MVKLMTPAVNKLFAKMRGVSSQEVCGNLGASRPCERYRVPALRQAAGRCALFKQETKLN